MKIEHVAFNVASPVEMADWYVNNLGLTIVRKTGGPAYAHFLADDSGLMMIEIYNNPADQVPEYSSMNPLLLHLAFVSDEPEQKKSELISAGATFVSEVRPDDGSHIVMMRDPWGLAIQLCKRGRPMLRNQA
ncbi:MAG TPA: VOC family protein [Blastocatellia bacterium]|nr:VOC family protein [Blastocatellia bacterium]